MQYNVGAGAGLPEQTSVLSLKRFLSALPSSFTNSHRSWSLLLHPRAMFFPLFGGRLWMPAFVSCDALWQSPHNAGSATYRNISAYSTQPMDNTLSGCGLSVFL